MEEKYGFLIGGIVCLIFAILAIKYPKMFLNSRKSQFWIRMIGEEKTLLIIKYVSVPILLLVTVALFVMSAVAFGLLTI